MNKLFLYALLAVAIVFTAKTQEVEIVSPANGTDLTAPDMSVPLKFRIRGEGAKSILVEVLGEHTGQFFTVCSESACAAEQTMDLPIFAGQNVIRVTVRDEGRVVSEARSGVVVTIPERKPILPLPLPPRQEPRFKAPPPARSRRPLRPTRLLIIAPEDFATALAPLVAHKNATGMSTTLLDLRSLYFIPAYRGRDHAEIVKNAIADYRKTEGIQYVMLVGDSDRFPIRYTKSYDLAHWGEGFLVSDLYYADLFNDDGTFATWDSDADGLFGEMQSNFPLNADDLNQDHLDLEPDVAVGRVPASDVVEVETYVKKVIAYETAPPDAWFERALLVTGAVAGANETNDAVADALHLRGFQTEKLYHDSVWPVTPEPQRRDLIDARLNTGVAFVSYVGHGDGPGGVAHDGGVWGGWYEWDRVTKLTNAPKLPIVFSSACYTAEFHFGRGPYPPKQQYQHAIFGVPQPLIAYGAAPEPIAVLPNFYDRDAFPEHMLVKSAGGAIAYIGSYTGTQGGADILARYFFEAYGPGTQTLGDMWNGAITRFARDVIDKLPYPGDSWYTAATYHHIHKMLLFGDPSLRLRKRP